MTSREDERLGEIFSAENQLIDQVVLSVHRAPASYTGEDLLEISCHGGMLVTAVGMALLAASATRSGLIVVALVVAGAGMGLFVAANNASTMFAAPRNRAGAAGGLLNMARGLGTALGVALTSLVFASGRGLTSVALLLLAVALLAAVISAIWTRSARAVATTG